MKERKKEIYGNMFKKVMRITYIGSVTVYTSVQLFIFSPVVVYVGNGMVASETPSLYSI